MSKKRYYIACPYNTFTGGPTLAHQMCDMLRWQEQDAKMYYYSGNDFVSSWDDIVNTPLGIYHTKCASFKQEADTEDSVILVPETNWNLIQSFKHATCYVWWMSVYYYEWTTDWFDEKTNNWFKKEYAPNTLHFVQSKYAYDYCKDTLHIPEDNIHYLTDYIDQIYTHPHNIQMHCKDSVFYNPAKMSDGQSKLMEKYPQFDWVPITNMDKEEISSVFGNGKVYVDFGHHPGKDRMPREAAASKCCIITNKEGAAGNDADVLINDEYKFDNVLYQLDDIAKLIKDCIENYDKRIKDFARYRMAIKTEKRRFEQEVKNFIAVTSCDNKEG